MNRTYNIKEEGFRPVYKGVPPFMKFEDGHGYFGVLLEHEKTGKLQCHLCGILVNSLSKHLYHKHKKVSPIQYKIKTGLKLTTPLLSENSRKRIKNNFLNLTKEKRDKIIQTLLNNNKKLHTKGLHRTRGKYSSLEYNNRFGTCPEQAKTLFWEEYNKFGRIPSTNEMSGKLKNIIFTRFDSYKSACIAWGISEKEYDLHITEGKINAVAKRAENDYFPKYEKEQIIKIYSDFFSIHKRLPTWGEVQQFSMPGRVPFQRAFGVSKSVLERSFKCNAS